MDLNFIKYTNEPFTVLKGLSLYNTSGKPMLCMEIKVFPSQRNCDLSGVAGI